MYQLRSAENIQPCSSSTTGPSPPVSRRNISPRPGTCTTEPGGSGMGGSGAQRGIAAGYREASMATPNTFEGARLDRVTARRRDADWVAERQIDPDSRAVVLAATAVLVEDEELALV